MSTGELRSRFGKKNCNANQFFSPTRESKDSWRESEAAQPGTSRNGDGQLTTTQLTRSHITMNINRIIITGNLVADPTLRNTDSGTLVASATIANNEFYNDGEGERQQVTTFVDVTVWGKPAENFTKLVKKGQEVIIEGRLRRNDWESEDGQKHSKHFVRAESWQFTQYKKD